MSGVQTGLQAELSLSGSGMPEIQSEKKQAEEVRVCALAQKNLGLESLYPPKKQIKMALTKRHKGSAKEPTPNMVRAPFLNPICPLSL